MPYEQTVDTDGDALDLGVIGVPLSGRLSPPTSSSYPTKFFPAAKPIWDEVVNLPSIAGLRVDVAWKVAMQEFLDRCETQDVDPYPANTDTTRNEFVQSEVRTGRILIKQFVERVNFFKGLKVRTVYRQYTRTRDGFNIKCWGELYPVRDYPNFREWLVHSPLPRFLTLPNRTYVKPIRPSVNMWVRYVNDSRITIGYTIRVKGTINIPGNKTPTRREVDDFIDQTIFLPAVRAHRFRAVMNRLF